MEEMLVARTPHPPIAESADRCTRFRRSEMKPDA